VDTPLAVLIVGEGEEIARRILDERVTQIEVYPSASNGCWAGGFMAMASRGCCGAATG
jgi:hypothetical protein